MSNTLKGVMSQLVTPTTSCSLPPAWDVEQRLVAVGKNSGYIDLVCGETLAEVTEHGGDGDAVEVEEEEHGGKEEGDLPDGDERVNKVSRLLQSLLDPPQLPHGGKR